MTKEKIEEIRKGLKEFHGSVQEVVAATEAIKPGGYSRRHVELVLRGVWKNDGIILIAAKVLSERRAKAADTAATVQRLLSAAQTVPA